MYCFTVHWFNLSYLPGERQNCRVGDGGGGLRLSYSRAMRKVRFYIKDISKICDEFTFFDIDQSSKDLSASKLDGTLKKLHSKVLSYPKNIQNYLRGENGK